MQEKLTLLFRQFQLTNMKEEDVIKVIKEWKDEIVKLKDDYHQDIQTLKATRDEIIAREKKTPWGKFFILAGVAACVLISVIIFAFNPEWCTFGVELSGIKVGILRGGEICGQ